MSSIGDPYTVAAFRLLPNAYNETMKVERSFKPTEPIESSPTMQIRRRDAPNPDRCIGIGRNGAKELAALSAKDNRKKKHKRSRQRMTIIIQKPVGM